MMLIFCKDNKVIKSESQKVIKKSKSQRVTESQNKNIIFYLPNPNIYPIPNTQYLVQAKPHKPAFQGPVEDRDLF